MLPDGQDRLQRKKRLLEFYGQKPAATAAAGGSDARTAYATDPCNIDSSAFEAKAYLTSLLKKCDLSDLMAKETEISEQIRSLDSEMQTLVYDNYNKFINATHTIKMVPVLFFPPPQLIPL